MRERGRQKERAERGRYERKERCAEVWRTGNGKAAEIDAVCVENQFYFKTGRRAIELIYSHF